MPKPTPHAPQATDHRVDSALDPKHPATLETPRRTGQKAPEPNPHPRRPGDDERDAGLVGGAAPTAPAKHVDLDAQQRGQEVVNRKTQA